jgi:hypothetical protein
MCYDNIVRSRALIQLVREDLAVCNRSLDQSKIFLAETQFRIAETRLRLAVLADRWAIQRFVDREWL